MLKHLRTYLLAYTLGLLLVSNAWAHGEDDHSEHSHAAPGVVLETSRVVPTLTAESEQFELVARLYANELGIYIDDWSSNAPVLGADVEVEMNGRKAIAKFHKDHGDYALADAEMLKAMRSEGEHALLFTIVAAKKSDLLTGTLLVKHDEHMAAEAVRSRLGWLIGALAILIGLGMLARKLLRTRKGNGL